MLVQYEEELAETNKEIAELEKALNNLQSKNKLTQANKIIIVNCLYGRLDILDGIKNGIEDRTY